MCWRRTCRAPGLRFFHQKQIDLSPQNINDSQLQMMIAICHPSISTEAQIALSLRILCGFGVEEIADAFLTNKEIINKRLFRAKEKLRDILSYKLTGIAFSAEKANQAQQETHGIGNVEEILGLPTPAIYSPDASLFVLRAGVALIETFAVLERRAFVQNAAIAANVTIRPKQAFKPLAGLRGVLENRV
jgi:hypothetical protein